MSMSFEPIIHAVRQWCTAHGIQAQERPMHAGKAGEFNGISLVMNSGYDAEEGLYYMLHAIGSIVRWSLSRDSVQQMFDELREAKKAKEALPDRFELAIARYRAFEIE